MPQNIVPLYITLNDYPNFLTNLSLIHIAYFNSKIYPLKEQSHPLLIYFVSDDLISSKHFAGMCLLSAVHRIYLHCTCHSAALLTVASMILIPSLQAFS